MRPRRSLHRSWYVGQYLSQKACHVAADALLASGGEDSPAMRRLLPHVAAIVSLTLLIPVVAVWARINMVREQFVWSSNGQLWILEGCLGRISLSTVYQWPGRQPLRWCRPGSQHAPGPLEVGNPLDDPSPPPETRWHGLTTTSQYAHYALRDDGSGYVSDADGLLPTHPFLFSTDASGRGPPPHIGREPNRYSGPLLERWVNLPPPADLAVVLAVLPAFVWCRRPALLLARKAYRRVQPCPGICVRCGYDLRATPDRCPECGLSHTPADV